MLFLAWVKDVDFFAKMKIRFKRGMVHSSKLVFLSGIGAVKLVGILKGCLRGSPPKNRPLEYGSCTDCSKTFCVEPSVYVMKKKLSV